MAIKTIVCTGDSHTWGQGIPKLEDTFDPPVTAGDLRLVSFRFGCYVNLLREMINEKTGSSAKELTAEDIRRIYGKKQILDCAAVDDTPLQLHTHAQLIRIQFHYLDAPSKAAVYIDGVLVREIDLQRADIRNGYRTESFFCEPEGEHRLTVISRQGTVALYRIEQYFGTTAVLNCGVGSSPTFRYLSEYWNDYVVSLKPSLCIMEPHTINDWLAGDPPNVYGQHLKEMIDRLRAINCGVVMMTVAPIAGPQDVPFNKTPYSDYVEESRRIAKICGVPQSDANAVMNSRIQGLSEDEAFKLLFCDNWHVNAYGHGIYANEAYRTLIDMKYI